MQGRFLSCWKNLRIIQVQRTVAIVLYVLLPVGSVLTSSGIVEKNSLQVEKLQYETALHGWVMHLGDVMQYDVIIAETCNNINSSRRVCDTHNAIPYLQCSNFATFLQPEWALAGYHLSAQSKTACPGLGNLLNNSTSFVKIFYPNEIRISNDAMLLQRHAYKFPYGDFDDGENVVFDIQLKITFFSMMESLFTPTSLTYRSNLTLPHLTFTTLALQHVCTAAGFVAPPKSVLQFVQTETGDARCIWKCDSNYVRQPFNQPALTKAQNASSAGYNPVCVPLPETFVSAKVKSKLYIEEASDYNAFSTQLYTAIDALISELKIKAREMNLINAIIVVKHKGSVFDNVDFDTLLQQHSLTLQNVNSLTTYRINSNTQLRRLLQTTYSMQQFELEGLIVAQRDVATEQPVEFLQTVTDVFDETLQNYSWPTELQVDGVSSVEIETFAVNTANVNTEEASTQTISWQRTVLFAIEGVCALSILLRCCFKCRHHPQHENVHENVQSLLSVRVDMIKSL